MRKQSYHRAAFSDFDHEEQRLKRQATIIRELELQWLVRQGIQSTHRVLDLGCGNGETAALLSDYLSAGSVTGVDINPDFIAGANAAFTAHNLAFRNASAYQLDELPDFDFVYSRLLFQHLSEPQLALLQIWNHLLPGGTCCIIDVNDEWLFLQPSLPEFDAVVEAGIQQQRLCGGNRYIGATLPLLMSSAGFKEINIEIIPFSSLQVGMEAFLDITLSFRINMTPHMKPVYEQLQRKLTEDPGQWFGMMGVFMISARKPG